METRQVEISVPDQGGVEKTRGQEVTEETIYLCSAAYRLIESMRNTIDIEDGLRDHCCEALEVLGAAQGKLDWIFDRLGEKQDG